MKRNVITSASSGSLALAATFSGARTFCQCFCCHYAVYERLCTLCLISKTGPEKKINAKRRILNGYVMINGPFNAVCNHECTDIETVDWSNRNNLHWQVAQQLTKWHWCHSQANFLFAFTAFKKDKKRRIKRSDALNVSGHLDFCFGMKEQLTFLILPEPSPGVYKATCYLKRNRFVLFLAIAKINVR